MRERTPSADDTPKRAPPAPPREAASTDVAGSKTSSEALDASSVSKFSSATTASSTATAASSPSCVDARMVASTHNLDDLGVSASSDRQQQQEKHGYASYRTAQTAQDKRSRLSNVINNLRKKVPESRNGDSPRKEEDDRNSVERNLETLEKYVMTVLNGVIKDEEDEDEEDARNKEAEKVQEPEKLTADQDDEDSKGPTAKFEPSKPNESRTEAAVFLSEKTDKSESKDPCLEYLGDEDTNCSGQKDSQGGHSDSVDEEKVVSKAEAVAEEEICMAGKSEEQFVQDTGRNDSQESRSLGTIIMERLSENQSDEKQDSREFVSDNAELRNVCRDLLNDLLNGINQLIDENSQQKEEPKTVENSLEESRETREPRSQEFSMTSLHCSLPLDKVASVLQNCQTNELAAPQSPVSSPSTSQGSKSPCKPPSPTVRHCLCLYCDRKFMSISLRQRHTERVHQQGGSRRTERNSRKSSQNCQYCSDKCAESLEGLFQHMVGSHGDKYYGCLQCSTRYLTREALAGHMTENHGLGADRNLQIQEKMKESSPCKELGNQSPRPEALSPKERRSDDPEYEHRTESILPKPMLPIKDNFSNPGSPEFDSSFYSSVSCNIRENLLHHLDGKLQSSSSTVTSTSSSIIDTKPQQQQQQSFYEHSANQIQLPIDISLTAATPVYSKEYSNKEYENNSEYAQKPGKSNRSHPRRVSFEKYNFPRKYDGKEQWTCSIKDLSNFDISTQLFLRKKQQLLKERLSLNRLHQIPILGRSETTESVHDEQNVSTRSQEESGCTDEVSAAKNTLEMEQMVRCEASKMAVTISEGSETKTAQGTEFSVEFGNFLRLKRWDEKTSVEAAKKQEVVYAELTGEWSRPRVYICGACASKHVTLKDMEDHKVITHPNVWCSHFEFSGDQRELYKHLFLPGKDEPTAKARSAILAEKVCTKCSKNCNTLPELHRHMLECGGDQTWLLGLFGNGKKKCKWRPFGSRSRRRRQRGMKRNIQNSQTPRANTPKEKQPTGPRVRPSDRESIQKMLANLPPKRATRKVLQDSSLRSQGRLRNVQTRTRPRMVGENSSASRMSRNKAALRNKLLKNAKSIQRNRCRIDNISAVIESVVRNCTPESKKSDEGKEEDAGKIDVENETKEKPVEGSSLTKEHGILDDKGNRTKLIRGPRVLGKKRNVKTKEGSLKSLDQTKKTGTLKGKFRVALKNLSETKAELSDETTKAQKTFKVSPKAVEKETEVDGIEASHGEDLSPTLSSKNKPSTQITPKRKRPVDPVASLNASIKAKSQLRTQDGKFARNPNKESLSPQKSSPEMKSPVSGRVMLKAKGCEASPELSVTRSKFRAVSRNRNGEQLPKRTTRLSSDSDKMPTLEPAVQVPSAAEEFTETSANDLPILSPATPASSPEKVLRGKSLVSKCLNLDVKDNSKKTGDSELMERKGESSSSLQDEDKDQKQGKGRRPRGEAKNLDKSLESSVAKADGCKEVAKAVVKEKFKRRSAPARILNMDEKKGEAKSADETGSKKEMRQKKEDGKLETRSNSKAKVDNILDEENEIKIQNVPFEVKKLIGSNSKEDLLTKLVLTSRVAASKRCLRQPVAKGKPEQSEGKGRRHLELEKSKLDSGSTSDASTKKEKFDARRKSLRNADRKDKFTVKNDKMVLEDGNEIRDAVNEVKTAIRGRRSSSLSSDTRVPSSDGPSKIEVEAAVQNGDKRQTRGSLLNNSEGEIQSEVSDSSVKKHTVGRRRGRVKSSTDNSEKKSIELSQAKNDEAVDKDSSVEQSGLVREAAETSVVKDNQDEMEKDQSKVPDSTESNGTGKTNVSLSQLQVETSNSLDSGKENSLEAPAPVQKLKVGRPRKSWGPKKDRTAKRSLNSVIGILTEGMNIPVETQQSVLNVQTSVDNSNSDEFVQSDNQTVDTGASRSESVDKSNKSEPKLEIGIVDVTGDSATLVEEASPVQEVLEESARKIEAPETATKNQNLENTVTKNSKVQTTSKDEPPANDIILDLSRRKPKGKGSFLEKIVSKIAKQKDALLEGEVGSLLDTAADELTSILDEVGPSFPESTESFYKTRAGKKNRDSRPETSKEFNDEHCEDTSLVSSNTEKKLKVKDTKGEVEEKMIALTEEEPLKKILNDIENSAEKETKDETVSKPSNEEVSDAQIEAKSLDETGKAEEIQNETSTNESKVQEEVFDIEATSPSNKIEVPVLGKMNSKQEGSAKKDEDTKTKRKSKRRSLERNSPKKSKRKSIEIQDNSQDEQSPKELHLSDIINLIEKSKQVPSTTENTGDDSSANEAGVDGIQCGKRKTLNVEPDLTDSLENKAVDNVQTTTDDHSENTKKFKPDSGENSEENENGRMEIDNSSIDNSDQDVSEENSSLSLRIARRGKSSVEVLNQHPHIESPVKRTSKRRSLQEEKVNQSSEEGTVSKVEPTEIKGSPNCEITSEDTREARRRSSRTRCTVQSKNDEKSHEETENDSGLSMRNIVAAKDIELPVKISSEDVGSSKQGIPVAQTESLNTTGGAKTPEEDSILKNIKNQVENEEETVQNAPVSDLKQPEKVEEPPVVLKVPKKRGRKKKCLINDQTQAQNIVSQTNPDSKTEGQRSGLEAVANQLPPRRSLRTSRFNEESEYQNKHSNDLANLQVASSSLEHFKVPEVTEVLQHTKKRTYKRKSVTDDHSDAQNHGPTIEPEISGTENSDMTKSLIEKEEQTENSCQRDASEGRKRLSRGSSKEQLDLQRSSSSGSIDLPQTSRTRSSKRKQLSSEDLSGQEVLNRRAESVENLSETSCVSESSYFRKKRFSKKKKELQEPPEDVQTDTSVTDSESVDAEKSTDRRQSLKRRAKKNISFLEDLLFLVDGFDIPMDIQDCISHEDTVENNANQQAEPKQTAVEDDNVVTKTSSTEALTQTPSTEALTQTPQEEVSKEDEEVLEDSKESVAEEEEEEDDDDEEEEEDEEEELKEEEKIDEKADSLSQAQDDFQTPKKRSAGNYVVVHKKTGEILIVEKRKKLTKEAARFFCDVCTTSFTRKSSLKKHNQSQSHLIQAAKCKKDKTSLEGNEGMDDNCSTGQNDVSSDENPVDEVTNVSMESKDDQMEPDPMETMNKNNLEPAQEDSCYPVLMEQNSLIDSESNQQHMLEDELLDEEICKITENMSHDEYVLTDHVSPEPESASTPIKMEIKKVEEVGKKKKHEKKKEKAKKKILDDERIVLSSPELETPGESTLVSVLGENMSIIIAKSSHLNVPERNSKDTDVLGEFIAASNSLADSSLESRNNVPMMTENDLQNGCLDRVPSLHEDQDDVDMKIVEHSTVFSSDSKVYKLNAEEKTENFSKNSLENMNERLNLKFTINKRSIEPCKEIESESTRSFEIDYSSTLMKDPGSISLKNNFEPLNENVNNSEVATDQFNSNLTLFKPVKTGSKRSLEHTKESNVSKMQRIEEDCGKLLDNSIDQLANKIMVENKIENEKQSEPVKTARHGKSKRGRGKKHLEDMENRSGDKISKKLSKSKDIQSKLIPDEATKISEITSGRKSIEDTETFNNNEKSESPLNISCLENDSCSISRAASPEKLEDEVISNGLEIVGEQDALAEASEKSGLKQVSEENIESLHSEIKPFHSMDDDEASSSSSLADKPLSQILLERVEKLDQKKQLVSSTKLLQDSDEEPKAEQGPKVEEINPKNNLEFDIDDNSLVTNELTKDQKLDESVNNEQTDLQIASEEDSDKGMKILSESENSEAVPRIKSIPNEKESCETKTVTNNRKSSTSNRQTSGKKLARTHRYSNKDNYRKSKGKRASARNRIADLTSASDNSESEDKIESQNKSKIVKSVFGRVFGGEKTDKVKEVLNDWVSKSEDDSEASRTDYRSSSPNGSKTKESTEERNTKRHSVSSSISSSPKKRSGRKSKKSSSSDRAKEKISSPENQEEHRPSKHAKSKNSSNNRKKHEAEASNGYFQVLPSTKCRPSKKRAEELISRTFESDIFETIVDKNQKPSKHKEVNDGSKNQDKPDLMIKDSGYGSFHYDEDSSKVVPLEDPTENVQKVTKRRKSSASRKSKCKTDDEDWSDLILDKKASKNGKGSGDEEDSFIKDLPEGEPPVNRLSVDPESSQSCSILAPSSVRNRSPSMDKNSQTTRDFDVDEEEDEDVGHRRISPLFICGTPRSSVESSSNSENEEEDESMAAVNEAAARKRSSSEFSGEKIVIRSPSSTHKGEVVTIAPTDAIEDNALDVPQEIEATKPRQGKVLNFDEELFVECCSRLKATTENELRGAKKIKLDHNEGYHRKDEQQTGFRGPRDRWRDVESQNSLGSLLESVNQLLGEEMYSTRERDYQKRGGRNLRSEHSSRSASPDMSRADNLGYEDSLDVAFEHNNKLRDKIQQRMRESENLIASTFGQKTTNEVMDGQHPSRNNEQDILRNSYSYLNDQRHLSATNLSNGGYNDALHVRALQEQQSGGKIHLDSSGLKSKMNPSLGGLLDKALSNLLHNNEKHDHNGSTPMKVLAELACARAPTTTAGDSTSHEAIQPLKTSTLNSDSLPSPNPVAIPKDLQKKPRNPIKELFERKKEMNERKQQEKSKTDAALRELNVHRQRKTKKARKHQEFPLIRRNELGGLAERKKRRDGFERKDEFGSDRIKDVYEFDEEESQIEPNLGSVMSYRSRPGYEVSCLKTKEVDVAGLMSKAIGDSLENGKTVDALSSRLESMIDRKFKELEKFAPKTKGALKAFQGEEQQRQVTGPMDEFVERKQSKSKKIAEPVLKHSKLKKRSKNSKKKTRNAWYENDSSDEYRTAIKTQDVIGVGISKSQRTCSKGKQNIFAELYTSSESEYEDEGADYESRRQRRMKKTSKKVAESENVEHSQELINKYSSENEDHMDDWRDQDLKSDAAKHDSDNKKSESEMSDHPLVIDERKDADEQRNSDDETENQYERNYEMDDLYREDSSVVDSDVEDPINTQHPKVPEESGARSRSLPQEKTDNKTDYMQENELIPLEEALDLLDQADSETPLETKYGNRNSKLVEHVDTLEPTEPERETFKPVEQPVVVESPTPAEEQEEEPDNDLLALPEKLSSNEKPLKESENLPLHVFLSRKVQESKKRKEQQLKKMQEEQERILMDLQPTRRQRKCAIGKQGLLAEISSSDEELSPRDRKLSDKSDHEKPRKQKRESKEKKKERYIEKKHEQMIAKEQKAIEEEILREIGKKRETITQNSTETKAESSGAKDSAEDPESANNKMVQEPLQKKKHQAKEKQKKQHKSEEDLYAKNNQEEYCDLENNCSESIPDESQETPVKQKKHFKSPTKIKKSPKIDTKVTNASKKNKSSNADKKNKADSKGSKDKERRSSSGKRDSDDEELKTTKSWNKVEEGVGVAIGRRKRAAANQLYYWSSSSDEEELLEVVPAVEEEEDDRQEQHGWIVGDSHKRMITMLAMEKQLKEKRRRSEDEFEPGKAKSKKHRNSTS